jgi:hypothetical protein
MRKRIFAVVIICAAAAALLLAAEAALTCAGFEPRLTVISSPEYIERLGGSSFDEAVTKGLIRGPLGNLKPDEALGYTRFTEPHGFTDTKDFYDDWSDSTRILVLGDSFTEGKHADPGKGFIDLLGGYYKDRNVIFFNTAVSGYGQNNQLAVLKEYGDAIKPHLVLLCFYAGNDFLDNLTPLDRFTAFTDYYWVHNYYVRLAADGPKVRRRTRDEVFLIYQQLIGNELVDTGDPSLKAYLKRTIFYRTRLGSLVWQAARRAKEIVTRAVNRNAQERRKKIFTDYHEDYFYTTTKEYVSAIQAYARQIGAPLHVFIIPAYYGPGKPLDETTFYRWAVSLCEELSLPHTDPCAALTPDQYTGKGGGHWDNEGHASVYRALREYLDTFLEESP